MDGELGVGDVVEVLSLWWAGHRIATVVAVDMPNDMVWFDGVPGRVPAERGGDLIILRRFEEVSDEELAHYRRLTLTLSAQLHFRGLGRTAHNVSLSVDKLNTALSSPGVVGWWE